MGAAVTDEWPEFQVIHVVHREGLSSVFASQVLLRVAEMGSQFPQEVVLQSPLGQLVRPHLRRRLAQIRRRASQLGVRLSVLPSPPTRGRLLWSDGGTLTAWLAWRTRQRQRTVLHCRATPATMLGLHVRRRLPWLRVVHDCRGAMLAEFLAERGFRQDQQEAWPDAIRAEYERLARDEQRAFREADASFCVSRAMAAYYRAKYDLPTDRLAVVPCCVPVEVFAQGLTRRNEMRKTLGLEARLVVAYAGSLVWYQLPEQAIRIFRLIQQHRPDAAFLAIVTDPERMRAMLQLAGIAESAGTVRCVSQEQVPDYLAAADLGLLLREDSLVNQLASPVKFGEYLASGTPVVISRNVGDYSNAVQDGNLGVVLDTAAEDPVLEHRLRNFLCSPLYATAPQRCVEYANSKLSWRGYRELTREVYSALWRSPGRSPAETSVPNVRDGD